jgi:hypothetical protein
MGKKKRAKRRSRRRKGQPLAKSRAAQPVDASDRPAASEPASDVEAPAAFDPTPLERKAERDQERRAWDEVDEAP